MTNKKIVKNSLNQTLGNMNLDSNFSLQCIFCGNDKKLIEIAHRNAYKHITGTMVICTKCFNLIDIGRLSVKIVPREDG